MCVYGRGSGVVNSLPLVMLTRAVALSSKSGDFASASPSRPKEAQ